MTAGGKTFPVVTSPKSTESTNSTMPAYSFVPLIFTRGDTRGGAHSLIRIKDYIIERRKVKIILRFFLDLQLLIYNDIMF